MHSKGAYCQLLYPVKVNDLWGYIDTTGKIMIEPAFTHASKFNFGYAVVRKKQNTHILKANGELSDMISARYVEPFSRGYFRYYNINKVGIISVKGKVVCLPFYAYIYQLPHEQFLVKDASKYGIIDSTGAYILELKYDSIIRLGNLFIAKEAKNYSVFNTKGKTIVEANTLTLNFHFAFNNLLYITSSNKTYILNTQNSTIIFSCDSILKLGRILCDRFLWLKLKRENLYYDIKKQEFLGLKEISNLNCQDKKLVYIYEDSIRIADSSGIPYPKIVFSDNTTFQYLSPLICYRVIEKYGLRDYANKEILPLRYKSISAFTSYNFAVVIDSTNRKGIINQYGKWLIKPSFNAIVIDDNVIKTDSSDVTKLYSISEEGILKSVEVFKDVYAININVRIEEKDKSEGVERNASRQKDFGNWFFDKALNKWGLKDNKGKMLIPPKYDNINMLGKDGLTLVSKRISLAYFIFASYYYQTTNRYGLVNPVTGQILYEPTFLYIDTLGLCNKKLFGATRAINTQSKFILISETGRNKSKPQLYIEHQINGYFRFYNKGRILRVRDDNAKIHLASIASKWYSLNKSNNFPGNKAQYSYLSFTGGAWGIFDVQGKMVIKPSYYKTFPVIKERFIAIDKKDNFGLISISGDTIYPFIYSYIEWAYKNHCQYLLLHQKGNFKGLVDTTGKVITPAVYSFIDKKHSTPLMVKKGNEYGWLNTDYFYTKIPCKKAKSYTEGLIPVKIGAKWGYMDTNLQTVIEPTYSDAFPFEGDRALVKKKYKFGYIDHSGNPLIDLKYNAATSFKNGYALVSIKNNKFTLIDESGKHALNKQFRNASINSCNNFLIISTNRIKYVFEVSQKKLLNQRYDKIVGQFSGIFFTSKRKKIMAYTMSGEKIFVLRNISEFKPSESSIHLIKKKNSYNLVNNEGNKINSKSIKNAKFWDGKYLITQAKDQSYICQDTRLIKVYRLIRPNEVVGLEENLAVIRNRAGYTYQNSKGTPLFSTVFSRALPFKNQIATAKLDSKWGLIHSDGYFLTEFIFDHIMPFENSTAVYQMNSIKHLGDLNGNLLVMDVLGTEEMNLRFIRVSTGNQVFYLNMRTNQWLWPAGN